MMRECPLGAGPASPYGACPCVWPIPKQCQVQHEEESCIHALSIINRIDSRRAKQYLCPTLEEIKATPLAKQVVLFEQLNKEGGRFIDTDTIRPFILLHDVAYDVEMLKEAYDAGLI